MQKITLSLCAVMTLCFTQGVAQTSSKNEKFFVKKEYKTLYTKALKHYKDKEYEVSYKLFNQLFLDNLDNILINYYLGRSAYFTHRFEFALSAYDRILIQEPNNMRVRVELGQTYLKMGLWAQALEEFTNVSKGNLPPKVKQRVMRNIELLNNKQKNYQFTTYANVTWMYDSNISNISDISTYDIYVPATGAKQELTNSSTKEAAAIIQSVASLNYKYKVNDAVVLDNVFTFANLKYLNHKEKDLQVFSLNVKPTYYMKDYRLSLGLNASRVRLGHVSYQNSYFFDPAVLVSLGKRSLYETGVRLSRTGYYGSNLVLDAKSVEWHNLFRYVSEDYGLIGWAMNIGRENEVNEVRNDVSYNYYDTSLSHNYEVIKGYNLSTSLGYKRANYVELDTTYNILRKDNNYTASLSIDKKFTKHIIGSLGTTYTKRDSNIGLFDYDKYVIRLGVSVNF